VVSKFDDILAGVNRIEQALTGEVPSELFDAICGDGQDTTLHLFYTSDAVYQAGTRIEISRRGDTINMSLTFYGHTSLHIATLRRGGK
jgi:hypothetical protein